MQPICNWHSLPASAVWQLCSFHFTLANSSIRFLWISLLVMPFTGGMVSISVQDATVFAAHDGAVSTAILYQSTRCDDSEFAKEFVKLCRRK